MHVAHVTHPRGDVFRLHAQLVAGHFPGQQHIAVKAHHHDVALVQGLAGAGQIDLDLALDIAVFHERAEGARAVVPVDRFLGHVLGQGGAAGQGEQHHKQRRQGRVTHQEPPKSC